MKRISGPAGLPHSCAEMVSPSGVLTVIGFGFSSPPKPGCAIAENMAAAITVVTTRPPVRLMLMESSRVILVVGGRAYNALTEANTNFWLRAPVQLHRESYGDNGSVSGVTAGEQQKP